MIIRKVEILIIFPLWVSLPPGFFKQALWDLGILSGMDAAVFGVM